MPILNCLWIMQAEEYNILQINITDFYLEGHAPSGGFYDYFEVIDGQYTSDHVIYRQCGNQMFRLYKPREEMREFDLELID